MVLNNEDFTNTFGKMGGVYDNFIKQISNAPDDISLIFYGIIIETKFQQYLNVVD